MFKTETGVYVVAVVGVLAILFLAMLSQGGLPAVFDGDITGDAKRVLMQKNVPAKKMPAVAKVPMGQSGQQEIWEEGENSEELVQDCLENGYFNVAMNSWDYTPTLAECQEWAESQVQMNNPDCVIDCHATNQGDQGAINNCVKTC